LAAEVEPAYGPHGELNPFGEPFGDGDETTGEEATGDTAGIT